MQSTSETNYTYTEITDTALVTDIETDRLPTEVKEVQDRIYEHDIILAEYADSIKLLEETVNRQTKLIDSLIKTITDLTASTANLQKFVCEKM